MALPKIKNTRLGVFLIRFAILSAVRKLGIVKPVPVLRIYELLKRKG